MKAKAGICALALSAFALSTAAAPASSARWITLGTAGGPPLHASQAQISNALVVGDAVYLFDLGNGVLRQMDAAKLPVRQVRAVFISHNHLDHNADLGPVVISHWMFGDGRPLPVLGPAGTATLANGLVAANAPTISASTTNPPAKPPLAATVAARDLPRRLNEPTPVYQDENIRVTAINVDHFHPTDGRPKAEIPDSLAFRVEAGGRVYVYSGDTGPSHNLERLAQGADVLITEVVDLPAIKAALRQMMKDAPPAQAERLADDMASNHLTPEAIGAIAAAAEVKRVVLTHYVPAFEAEPDLANYTRGISLRYKGPVSMSHDLDTF